MPAAHPKFFSHHNCCVILIYMSHGNNCLEMHTSLASKQAGDNDSSVVIYTLFVFISCGSSLVWRITIPSAFRSRIYAVTGLADTNLFLKFKKKRTPLLIFIYVTSERSVNQIIMPYWEMNNVNSVPHDVK